MGPFQPLTEIEGLIFLAFMVGAVISWLFQKGVEAARAHSAIKRLEASELLANHDISEGAPPPGMEHFLACDRCGAETDQLLRRGAGPDLCKTCFGFPEVTPQNTLPAQDKTQKPTGASG